MSAVPQSAIGRYPDPVPVHVVGIGGAGMSALALALKGLGHRVTGSDLKASGVTERLVRLGIPVTIGHAARNLGSAGLVTASRAVAVGNPELTEARSRGVPVLTRSEVLAAVAGLRRCVAVSGTHGKTTTASMLSLILVEAGLRPSFLVGGDVNEISTNAVWDQGEWLVVEADESDGSFLALEPEIAVINNVEVDHLDHYGTFGELCDAFDGFARSAGHVVAGGDDPVASELGAARGADLVGMGSGCNFRISDLRLGRSSIAFDLLGPAGDEIGHLTAPVAGEHNARNAAVATVAALAAGIAIEAAVTALARFAGVSRRFEFRGSANGVTMVDDYAHLPTEITAALAAARNGAWDRVVAVFQPHRFGRTAELWSELGASLSGADLVVVTDVYGAGEPPVPGVTGQRVADAVRDCAPLLPVYYAPGRSDLRRTVAGHLRPGDLCLTLGAGDLTTLPDELLSDPTW
ncbi:MAG: UDP-N-acetylmuramate--L-alanine ligase [Acidimicrobiales bacterium]